MPASFGTRVVEKGVPKRAEAERADDALEAVFPAAGPEEAEPPAAGLEPCTGGG